MPHSQRTPNSCGPDCVGILAAQFGISQQAVDNAFGFPNVADFKDLSDTPANHISVFRKLGLQYRTVDADQICRGECKPLKTEILLHAIENPKTIWLESWGSQHWVVLETVNLSTREVFLDFGTPDLKEKRFTFKDFKAAYSRGGPTNTAYEVTGLVQPTKPKWWVRLWCWLSGKK